MPPGGGGGGEAPTPGTGDPRHEQRMRLVRKASELATRCAVPVALSDPAIDGVCEPLRWPSMDKARDINNRYKALPENGRRKISVGDAADLANQAATQPPQGPAGGGESASAANVAAAFGAMPEDELRELLRSIDCSLAAASHAIQKAADEAEQKLSLQRAGTLMAVDSSSQDAVPPIAAPMDMGDEVQGAQPPPDRWNESRAVHRPNRNGVAYEAEQRRACALTVDSQEDAAPPPPASGNGVADDGEYINLGGYMIERNRFEEIWREHAIPPPQSLLPESLPDDDGEPLRLWSFNDGERKTAARGRSKLAGHLSPMPRGGGGGEARVTPAVAGEQRRAALEMRKERLVRKASSLATRCDVPVAVICPGVGAGGEPTWWPSKEEVWAIATRYKSLPEKDRRKHSVDNASYRENQAAAKQGPGGGGGELAMAAAQVDGIAAMPDKAADEAEQRLSLERAHAHAGALMVDSREDAAPPPPPQAASGNGVAYDGEYINLGGYMIEHNRFEAIWREHAIPPPQNLLPESLPDDDGDGGEPLRLWSFDDGETRWKKPLRGGGDQSSLDFCVDEILDKLVDFRSTWRD
uniref:Uncharacterized protein n=1 Tax=Oryza meridionalis TaxID=40149 RepID=A0A0E0CC03_9ORYZ